MLNYHTTKDDPKGRLLPILFSSDASSSSAAPEEPTRQDRSGTPQRGSGSSGGGSGTDPNQAGEAALSFLSRLRTDQKIALAGAVVAAVGSFLPWATFLGTSIGGLQGDGVITLLLAIVAAGITTIEPDAVEKWNSAIVGGCGVLIVLVGLVSLTGAAAIGLFLTIIGGLVIAFPQAMYMYRRYQSASTEGV